jgi:hypothetical protein
VIKIVDFEYDTNTLNDIIEFYISFEDEKKVYYAELWKGGLAENYIFISIVINDKEKVIHFGEEKELEIIHKTIEKIKEVKELRIKAVLENWKAWKKARYTSYYESLNEKG